MTSTTAYEFQTTPTHFFSSVLATGILLSGVYFIQKTISYLREIRRIDAYYEGLRKVYRVATAALSAFIFVGWGTFQVASIALPLGFSIVVSAYSATASFVGIISRVLSKK